ISNLSLKLADGHEVLSSSSVAPSSSSAAVVKYDIKFVVNGKVIQTIKVAEGEIPEAPTSVELPKNDAQYSYSFGGWTPEIVAVTGPATYTANIVQTINAYKITFLNYDNSELWWAEVNYGKVPVYGGPEPTREPSKSYRYEFKGWNPELKKVVGKASYTATYNEIPLSESSSSVQVSSSSTETSSSSVASSASTGVVVTGDLTQNVVKGAEFETVTFTNVTSFTKETYYIWWLSYDYVGNTLTISNSQSTQWLQAGDWNEKINVNGTTYEIQVTVVEPESSAASSSSSSTSRPSSSSWGSDVASCNSGEYSSSAVTPASSGSSMLALRSAMKFPVSVAVNDRTLLIEGGQATVEVFDLQGRPLARFSQVSGAVELAKFNAGSYILRVKSGTQVQNRKITLK
ncbi:MAG: T9SS type A sorting domain-containing protein, partial [Fibrobacter sp.]|nr:T9SS type A sorting domain-containing protein [Fibrobacter sp.]